MLVIDALASNGLGFKAGGVWYNVPKGTFIPPKGSTVEGQITQGMAKNGAARYEVTGLHAVGYAQQPVQQVYAPAVQQQAYAAPATPAAPPAPAYKPSSYNSGRGDHDTTAEQKLRYNALTLAVAFDKGGSVDSMISVAGQLYDVIKDGFIPATVPIQQAAVQQVIAKPKPAVQAAAYSAYQQPSFESDDLPFEQ
jgi:hypothetical protein